MYVACMSIEMGTHRSKNSEILPFVRSGEIFRTCRRNVTIEGLKLNKLQRRLYEQSVIPEEELGLKVGNKTSLGGINSLITVGRDSFVNKASKVSNITGPSGTVQP